MPATEIASSSPLLLTNIGQLLTLRGEAGPRRGRHLGELGIIRDAAVFCFDGRIALAGRKDEVCRSEVLRYFERALIEVDCKQGVVLPGLVDSHTHPVFVRPRLDDFERRIAGATYQEIARLGGGIRSSVRSVREASEEDLSDMASSHFEAMLRQGTTTIEAKSGYGLSVDSEINSLRALRSAAKRFAGTIVKTLLGAHVVPSEYEDRRDDYLHLICDQMIPEAAKQGLADFVDVFCERSAFTLEETELVFASARKHGMDVRAHICQFSATSLERILRFNPASLDHMECVADEDLSLMAQSDCVVTLLPGATYFLGHTEYANARKLIELGVAIALATDFNPGTSPTPSMAFMLSLACTHLKLSPSEAISAATINGAHALRLSSRKGSIEEGKDADLAVFDVRDYREIAYWFAVNRCRHIVARGRLISN